ncbi:hypothetical protein [Rubrivirga sp.]|uniref:hypothetical protein n=1 Tax=Rubrivirga sp. TaxID=1885344 RepID=UPI003B52724B
MPTTIKEEARRIVDALPDEATWEDLMYRLYVREAVEQGMADSDAGRTRPTSDVRARLGLSRPATGDAA